MDDLIIRHLSGTLSPFEEERLRHWRDASSENEAHFQEFAGVWGLTAPEPTGSASAPPSVETIVAEAARVSDSVVDLALVDTDTAGAPSGPPRGGLQQSDSLESRRRRAFLGRNPWMAWGLLAASVAAVGLGIRVLGPGGPEAVAIHRVAEADDPVTLTLDDGSFVRLAPGATLRELAVEGRREVSLEGRGFFAVARDETRPFVVRTEAGRVQVLGTRFQVDAQEEWVETVVVEGLVQVSNDHGSVEVPAGNQARMEAGVEPRAFKADDVFALLDWDQGALVFQATPLGQVVEEVAHHYGREIVLEDAGISQRRVTAWFQGDPFEAVAESLCLVTEADCRTEGGTVTMGTGESGGER